MTSISIETEDFDLTTALPPKDIFAFNELRSCADLKRMYDKKQMDISPDFQRNQVWNPPAQARFLDSLLKNLPIPSMCISLDTNTNQRIVIDGLQRITTVIKFLEAANNPDSDFRLPVLDDIDDSLSGRYVSEIVKEEPEIIETIENATIPVTVLRCSLSKEEHMEYIFTIFHRLNTGGIKLNSQEIRNGILNGKLSRFLSELSELHKDELSFLLNSTENKRFEFEEFLLRFFAFQERSDSYKNPLTRFLNNYMSDYRNLSDYEMEEKKSLLSKVLDIAKRGLSGEKVASKVITEAILYGISKNLDFLNNKNEAFLLERIQIMQKTGPFSPVELQEGIFKTKKVKDRLEAAKLAFSDENQNGNTAD